MSGRVYGLRACFTPRVIHALTFICGGRGSEMGHTVGRPPGGLTGGRGRGFLGLGGLRACEGVRGRARACKGVRGRARACEDVRGRARACEGVRGRVLPYNGARTLCDKNVV